MKHSHIAIAACAVIGAQLPSLLDNPKAVQSLDCFQSAVEGAKPYSNSDPWEGAPAVPASSSKTPAKGLTVSDYDIDAAIAREREERQAEHHSALPIGAPAQAEPAPDEPVAVEPVESEPMIQTIHGEMTRDEYNRVRRAMPLGTQP